MFNSGFFPTPAPVAEKMLAGLSFSKYSNHHQLPLVLEPSAGKGDLLDAIKAKMFWSGHPNHDEEEQRVLRSLFAIEIEPDLRAILAGKGYQLIDHDFMAHFSERAWDYIIMNPAFDVGHKHLRKALEIGRTAEIRCLLNTATIENPHTAEHKLLLRELSERGAITERLGQVFMQSERRTGVDVTLVKVPAMKGSQQFTFRYEPAAAEKLHTVSDMTAGQIETADVISSLAARYDAARRCGAEIYAKLAEFEFYIKGLVNPRNDIRPGTCSYDELLESLRRESWASIYTQTKLANLVTTKVKDSLDVQQKRTGAMAFTEGNIRDLLLQLMASADQIMIDVVQEAFDLFTKYHKENRVHIEGWKSNDAWRVARKCILPNALDWFHIKWGSVKMNHTFVNQLADIEKALCMISGVKFIEAQNLISSIGPYESLENGVWHDSQFFRWKIFKKGTMHLEFKDKDLWQRFNKIACQGRNWIGGGFSAA